MKARKSRLTHLGLNEHGRISWNDYYNRACVHWARNGLSIQTISRWTGLTVNQVVYRCRKKGLSVTDYRNGKSARAMTLYNQYQAHHNKKTG